jgi:4-diphosphocytidyl-2-C-methyl-D-erythritol kinase
VNLGLGVLGRRADGYHRIESLFAPIELADEVSLEIAPAPTAQVTLALEGAEPGVPAGEENLAVRAARLFLDEAGAGASLRIRLRKRIPAGAGLGGGSSDAGAVLAVLAHRFPMDPARLAGLALRLGADVPYFLDPEPALVSGIGERIEPVAGLPALPLLLAHPGTPLATARVYAAHDELAAALTPPGPPPTMGALSGLRENRRSVPLGDLLAILCAVRNDLEPAAVRLCPEIARLRERIGALGAAVVGMAGSGPTVFGVFRSEAEAARAEGAFGAALPARVWRTRTRPSRNPTRAA